ncbi:uncharacterized protein O3C94_004699 [Discoglossus pictus]
MVEIQVCEILAVLFIATLLNKIDINEEEQENISVCKSLFTTVRQLKDIRQCLLIPLTIFGGFQQAFIATEYTKAYATCTLGIQFVGYVMICFAVTNSVLSAIFGKVSEYTGRIALFMLVPRRSTPPTETQRRLHRRRNHIHPRKWWWRKLRTFQRARDHHTKLAHQQQDDHPHNDCGEKNNSLKRIIGTFSDVSFTSTSHVMEPATTSIDVLVLETTISRPTTATWSYDMDALAGPHNSSIPNLPSTNLALTNLGHTTAMANSYAYAIESTATSISCIIGLLLWSPNPNQLALFFIFPSLWSLSDAICQTLLTETKEAKLTLART